MHFADRPPVLATVAHPGVDPCGKELLEGKALARGARWRGVLAAGVFLAAALVAWPFSETAFGDDFSYSKSAFDFARTGHLVYNGWGAPMLGFQAVWGALFLRTFGYSLSILRVSTLVLATACIYLFHQVLVRFGAGKRDAVLGALSLGLTPLFLPMAASFLTDIPGLFSVLLCTVMCQRAVAARTDERAAGWIVAAALGNVVFGSVRQNCWLGALVMVPATAWYLRERKGVLRAGAISWVVSALVIFGCVRWLSVQPWTIPESVLPSNISLWRIGHLSLQFLKASLLLTLLSAPVAVGWLGLGRRLGRAALLRVGMAVLAGGVALAFLTRTDHFEPYLMPWLWPVLAAQGMAEPNGTTLVPVTLHLGARVVISLLVVALGAVVLELAVRLRKEGGGAGWPEKGAFFWIMVPAAVGVVVLLCPRGMFYILQDRYVVLLIPVLLVWLIRTYEQATARQLPLACAGVLLLFAAYGIAGLHDFGSCARAYERAMGQLQAAGVPRTSVAEGFGPDEWVQVNLSGHVNNVNFIHSKLGFYDFHTPDWPLSPECLPFDHAYLPSFHPVFFLTTSSGPCFVPSSFAPVPYTTWLPPYHRQTFTVVSAEKPALGR